MQDKNKPVQNTSSDPQDKKQEVKTQENTIFDNTSSDSRPDNSLGFDTVKNDPMPEPAENSQKTPPPSIPDENQIAGEYKPMGEKPDFNNDSFQSVDMNKFQDAPAKTENNQQLPVSEPQNSTFPGPETADIKKEEPPSEIKTDSGGSVPPPWVEQESPIDEKPEDNAPSADESDLVKQSPIKKIILIIVAVVLLLLAGFAGIKFLLPMLNSGDGPSTPGNGEKITLNYWGLWESEELMAEIISEFENQNPTIQINYQHASHKDYRERLQSALAEKKAEPSAGPDIFRYHSTWLPMLQTALAPIQSKSINIDDYYPIMKESLYKNNTLYGVPLMYEGLALFYNTEMLNTAGQQVPTTWDEVQSTAAEMTVIDDNGRIQTAGIALGTAGNVDNFSDILALMMLQNNASLDDPSDNNAADALTYYTLFNTRDNLWDKTLPSSTYAFATGKAAMIFAPSWRAFEIQSINPDLKFQTAPVPQLPDNQVSWASFWVEGISSDSDYIAETTLFLEYLSKDETLRDFYSKQSQHRLFGEIYPKPALAEELKNDPIVGAFVQQADYAQTWYMCSRTHDNGINDKIIKYYENAINAMAEDGALASEVLATVSEGVKQVLSTYKLTVK